MTKPNHLTVVGEPKFRERAEVRERYKVSNMTLDRWGKDPAIDFPKPIKITPNGKCLWLNSELVAFDERMAAAPRKPGRRPGPRSDPADASHLDIEDAITPAHVTPAEDRPVKPIKRSRRS